jgi:hypothetical protein
MERRQNGASLRLTFGSNLTPLKLLLADDTEVGCWHNKSFGMFGHTAHPAYLEVSDEVLQDLDDIVFAFIYLWIRNDENGRTKASAASVSSSTAAVAATSA